MAAVQQFRAFELQELPIETLAIVTLACAGDDEYIVTQTKNEGCKLCLICVMTCNLCSTICRAFSKEDKKDDDSTAAQT
jgi:hypothetical protein